MRFTVSVRETFSASHSTTTCGSGLHGHTFWAEVTVEGEPDRSGSVYSYADIRGHLHAIVSEFDGRDLSDMLVPAIPEQLCLYLRERMALFFPSIVGVQVGTDSFSASVEFPLR